jgi:hypothetical protein
MLTQHGPKCDVCGDYILPGIHDAVHWFAITGIEQQLCCHTACRQAICDCGGDWQKLPPGPLRVAYEKAMLVEDMTAERIKDNET